MNITFIVPDYNYTKHLMPDYKGSFHHGVAYISNYLKKNGHNVSLLHLLRPMENDEFVESIKAKSPHLIAFTSFTHQFREVRRLVSVLKNSLKVPILCGGVHCTIDPGRALLETELDMVCIGEGEETMLELADTIQKGKDYYNIKGIWTKYNGKIIRNPVRPLIEDLDLLPFPDWELFRYSSLTEANIQKRVSVLATRGCPRNCGFCCNHAIKSVYPNKEKYVRVRRPIKVIEEIDSMLKEYPFLESVCFLDDTAGLYGDWLEEFSYLYSSKFSLPVHLNTRVEIVNNDRKLESFKRMGIAMVGLGFESGDEFIREILNRPMSNEDMIRAVKRCHASKIKVLTYNIVGLPFEDMNKILKTVKLNVQANTDAAHVSIFQPYPNTDLYRLCTKKGFIKEGDLCEGFFEKTILRQKSISSEGVNFSFLFFRIYITLFLLTSKLPMFIQILSENLLDFTFKNKLSQRLLLFLYFPFINPIISNKLIKKVIKNLLENVNKLQK